MSAPDDVAAAIRAVSPAVPLDEVGQLIIHLNDLLDQATRERSHYYVGARTRQAIAMLYRLAYDAEAKEAALRG